MRRVSHVRSLRHNQLFNKTRKAGKQYINTPQVKVNLHIISDLSIAVIHSDLEVPNHLQRK